MSSFTPGPWLLDKDLGENASDCGWSILQRQAVEDFNYRGAICSVTDAEHIDGITLAERDANARLIVTAPEMLGALLAALEFIEDQEDVIDGPEGQPVANAAMRLATDLRAVLLKATGDS